MPGTGSILDQIKARRESLSKDKFALGEIPTWGSNGHPRAWFRVQPVDAQKLERFRARAAKAKGDAVAGAVLGANASIIAAGTVGVVIGEGAGQAEFTLDSPDLLDALGIPEAAGRAQVVMALVGNDVTGADGFVIAISDAVARHSGFAAEDPEEALSGE